MEKLLWAYRAQHRFAEFGRADLQDYPKYRSILGMFRHHFGLVDLSFKEIDKFLWYTSKDLGL